MERMLTAESLVCRLGEGQAGDGDAVGRAADIVDAEAREEFA